MRTVKKEGGKNAASKDPIRTTEVFPVVVDVCGQEKNRLYCLLFCAFVDNKHDEF